MTISTVATALKAALNLMTPAQMADMLRSMQFGNMVRALPTYLFKQAVSIAAANPYIVATAQSITLPDDAKGLVILYAIGRAGAGTLGTPLIVDTTAGTAPAAGHIKLSPTGDILLNAADAFTSIDILYVPQKYDTQEFTLPVTTNVLTLPAPLGAAAALLEVEGLVGTAAGKKIVDMPGTAPAAGHAALNALGTTVAFQATDAITSARVKYGTIPATDINALLETVSNFL